MNIEIIEVDPADEETFRTFYDIYLTCGRHDAASFIASPYEELLNLVREPTTDFAYTAFLAYEGGQAVGHGWYAVELRANRASVHATPRVLPENRGRGIGTAILQHLEDHARAAGMTRNQTSPRWAMHFGPDGVGAPAVEFARRHGYDLALVEAKRRLALPVDGALLDDLAIRADPAYTISAFSGAVPEELVQGWAELEASLPTEAPTGDLETEEYPVSVASIRDDERQLNETGQVKYNAVAIAPNGEVADYTDIVVRAADEPAEQWGTVVRKAHRGHGLGYGLKAAVLRLLQAERPEVTSTITSNALDNTAMVAVNDRLGYTVLNYVGDVQKRLS